MLGGSQSLEIGRFACESRGMSRLLSTVEDVFQLGGGHGVVVVPGIPRESEGRVKAGDRVSLRRPDGTEKRSTIVGLEMASPPHPVSIPILLGLGVTKDDIPIGTELWVD